MLFSIYPSTDYLAALKQLGCFGLLIPHVSFARRSSALEPQPTWPNAMMFFSILFVQCLSQPCLFDLIQSQLGCVTLSLDTCKSCPAKPARGTGNLYHKGLT